MCVQESHEILGKCMHPLSLPPKKKHSKDDGVRRSKRFSKTEGGSAGASVLRAFF
jgi:hypothetical protein